MVRRALTVLLAGLVALSVSGCLVVRTVRGSGDLVEETRQVSDFTGVELASLGNLSIAVGETESLRIEAEDNLLKYIETEVRDGELRIASRPNVNLLPTKGIYFFLTVKDLEDVLISGLGNVDIADLETTRLSVEISGAGDVDMEDVSAEALHVRIGGGGDVNAGEVNVGTLAVDIGGGGGVDVAELNADALEVEISGLGDLHVRAGEVVRQEIVITGGGNHRARGLDSADTCVRLSGLGSATVRVRDSLSVDISGGGSVRYVGNPTVEQDVSGLGHVDRITE